MTLDIDLNGLDTSFSLDHLNSTENARVESAKVDGDTKCQPSLKIPARGKSQSAQLASIKGQVASMKERVKDLESTLNEMAEESAVKRQAMERSRELFEGGFYEEAQKVLDLIKDRYD